MRNAPMGQPDGIDLTIPGTQDQLHTVNVTNYWSKTIYWIKTISSKAL